MTLEVLKGPFDKLPAWSPSTRTFVRTRMGIREIHHGVLPENAGAWFAEKVIGGAPQYWQVDIGEIQHPEVHIEVLGFGGILKFDVWLNFIVRIIDARKALEQNLRSLEGYFTPGLRQEIAILAGRYDMAHSDRLQHDIIDRLGGSSFFGNGLASLRALTVQVNVNDPDAFGNMKDHALVPTKKKKIEADVEVTQAEIDAFHRMTGGMTIDALARVAIATGNTRLIEAYNNLRKLHHEEDQLNWERLKFLVDNKVVEPHDLEKYLGPLGDQILKALVTNAKAAAIAPKQIGSP